MWADLHIHTEYSCDSEAKIEEYVKQATAINLQMLCFTDHVDFNKNDYGYNHYNPEKFFEGYHRVKASCKNRIRLFAGIEFSEPHLYAEKLNQLSSDYPYDYIIGSIHWIGNLFPCQEVQNRFSAKEFYTLYWKEVLNTVKQGGFDALGHIDFPKRYYGEIYYTEAMMNEIFKYLLDKDMICLLYTTDAADE
ncbi:MAG: PHP domain-containing protein [Lachnospiraceae bacterium]|nr:PHP domain-containing protein [Lachnospiraceae bacterium]